MSLIEQLESARILAILRMDDMATQAVPTALQLHEHGIRAIECTLDRPGALAAIGQLQQELGSDTLVGAGTVTTVEHLEALTRLKVDFCVTPHLDPELLTHAGAAGIPMIPGVMTPSEVATAFRLGARAVKLFPAGLLGPRYLQALQGPFGVFPVIPTGSIDVEDVSAWLDAGATCVGLGSALTSPGEVPSTLQHLLT